MKSRVDL